MGLKFRQCNECRQLLPEKFFPVIQRIKTESDASLSVRRSNRCMGCRDKAADEKKARNRFIEKARSTIRRHAEKAMKEGWTRSKAEFCEVYGWNIRQIAHDMVHAYKNGCPICHKLYKDMRNAEGDLTLDIERPEEPPYYGLNTQYICMTDNRRKQRTTPTDYGEVMLGWRLWDDHQERLKEDEWAGTLFEGLNASESQLKLFK